MLFNSIDYGIFLIILMFSIELINTKKWQLLLLIVASYFFYYTDSGFFIVLLIYSSVLDYYCGQKIYTSQKKRLYLSISIIGNLAILFYFKYTNFGIDILNSLFAGSNLSFHLNNLEIILPIGISFYTFQTMSYTIDIYKGNLKPTNSFKKFALYVAFFPQLIAGPIVRAKDFLPQLKKIYFTTANLKLGMTYIGWGILKKIIFADNMAPFVNQIFVDPYSYDSFAIILATIAFAIQLYCDFSAYSDIAIGSAKIFGLNFPINFNKPFFAKNPSDFWKRWHISLSSWVNDYIYKPLFLKIHRMKMMKLVDNNKTRFMISFIISIIITEFLLGLWHGASWNFIYFGIWHGLAIIIYHLSKKYWDQIWKPLQIFLTLYIILLSFIIFRQRNIINLGFMLKKFIILDFNWPIYNVLHFLQSNMIILILMFVFIIVHSYSYYKGDIIQKIFQLPLPFWFIFLVMVSLLVMLFFPVFSTEFIYFQF